MAALRRRCAEATGEFAPRPLPPPPTRTRTLPLPGLQASIASVPTFKSFVHGKSTGQFSGANIPSLQAAVKALVEAK